MKVGTLFLQMRQRIKEELRKVLRQIFISTKQTLSYITSGFFLLLLTSNFEQSIKVKRGIRQVNNIHTVYIGLIHTAKFHLPYALFLERLQNALFHLYHQA